MAGDEALAGCVFGGAAAASRLPQPPAFTHASAAISSPAVPSQARRTTNDRLQQRAYHVRIDPAAD